MFEASAPFLFCDYFRIPYRVGSGSRPAETHPLATSNRLRWEGAQQVLYWPSAGTDTQPEEHRVGSTPIFAQVADIDLSTHGWAPHRRITDASGDHVASIWRDEQGNVFLPFDPAEAIVNFWSEAYLNAGRKSIVGRVKGGAMWTYYRIRPVVPRAAQIVLRRAFTRVQRRTQFPNWPLETGLHDLYALLFDLVTELAGEPVPWLDPWPEGRSWALVLTHDVETEVGYDHIHLLRGVEIEAGHRSSWNFVPRRYDVADEVVEDLQKDGFEVGVHGLHHDGRDLESRAMLLDRLPAIREYAERWGAVGFRSPATHRKWELMPLLDFDYDSSYPDTDPWEPVSGGCLSLLPFFNEALVELPITLPQDHTVFVILRRSDEELWVEKAQLVRDRGGMALLITHPDYMLTEASLDVYRRFLATFAEDDEMWRALPRDVAAWWRRRAASRLERSERGWQVVGPAAGEAVIRYGRPRQQVATASG